MATLPEHRRKGLADVILKRLLARIKSHAAKGSKCSPVAVDVFSRHLSEDMTDSCHLVTVAYVTLGADAPGRRLYERNGFRDTMPKEMGSK